MMKLNGKCYCDAEIGSVKRGWHTCGKPASVTSENNRYAMLIVLHWCEGHASRATAEGRTNAKPIVR